MVTNGDISVSNDKVERNEEEEEDGDGSCSSDDGILFQRGSVVAPQQQNNCPLPLAPPPHLHWQEGAILECLDLALDSYTVPTESTSSSMNEQLQEWQMPSFFHHDTESACGGATGDKKDLAQWKPQQLKLPDWINQMRQEQIEG